MTTGAREPVHFLVFSASLRAGSLNTRLARLVTSLIERHAGTVDSATMTEFDCPSYNQDAQSQSGIAPGAMELRRRLEANDAFVIVSPEYNASLPGLLKNPIDWALQGREFMNEVQVEFKKVTWPTQKETVGGTIGVIVLVALVALALFAVDGVLGWIMRTIWP